MTVIVGTPITQVPYASPDQIPSSISNVPPPPQPAKRASNDKKNDIPVFLKKTYHMIDTCDPSLASWSSENSPTEENSFVKSSFVIYDADLFAETVLPQYFTHKNFSSFVRQLNFYGFRKIRNDDIVRRAEKGLVALTSSPTVDLAKCWRFRHDKFQKGRYDLLSEIKKKTQNHQASNNVVICDAKEDVESLKKEVEELNDKMNSMSHDVEALSSLLKQMQMGDTRTTTTGGSTKKRKLDTSNLSSFAPATFGRSESGVVSPTTVASPVLSSKNTPKNFALEYEMSISEPVVATTVSPIPHASEATSSSSSSSSSPEPPIAIAVPHHDTTQFVYQPGMVSLEPSSRKREQSSGSMHSVDMDISDLFSGEKDEIDFVLGDKEEIKEEIVKEETIKEEDENNNLSVLFNNIEHDEYSILPPSTSTSTALVNTKDEEAALLDIPEIENEYLPDFFPIENNDTKQQQQPHDKHDQTANSELDSKLLNKLDQSLSRLPPTLQKLFVERLVMLIMDPVQYQKIVDSLLLLLKMSIENSSWNNNNNNNTKKSLTQHDMAAQNKRDEPKIEQVMNRSLVPLSSFSQEHEQEEAKKQNLKRSLMAVSILGAYIAQFGETLKEHQSGDQLDIVKSNPIIVS